MPRPQIDYRQSASQLRKLPLQSDDASLKGGDMLRLLHLYDSLVTPGGRLPGRASTATRTAGRTATSRHPLAGGKLMRGITLRSR